ncbi:MAG: 50S ribosomal protein L6 [Clostridia bacterium]|nr:50S ribosomal protein L6 [Clostridia bacterium]
MSRIGKQPIDLPKDVTIDYGKNNLITIKGPKGELTEKFHKDIKIEENDGQIVVTRPTDNKAHKSLHGLSRALLNNMVKGVTSGFEKKLQVVGVGYKCDKKGKVLVLNLGYSHPIEMQDPNGVETIVAGNEITVKGIDKAIVGNYAAKIREKRPPEPYKGKGIRYADEYVRRKEGKTAK